MARPDGAQQPAVEQFGDGRVGVRVADQRGQVRVVRQLPAERAGDPQRGPRGLADPRGEQLRRSGALGQRRQRHEDGVARLLLEDAGFLVIVVLVEGAGPVELVALAQERGRLYEAQRLPFGGEAQVPGPGRFLVRQRPSGARFEQGHAVGAGQPAEEDLFEVRVVGGGPGVGGGGQQVRALRRGPQQFVEGGAAHLEVVDEDDGAYLRHAGEESGPVGAFGRSLVHGGVQRLEQLAGLLVSVPAEPYDPVGGEVGAGVGDRVEQRRAPGSGRPGQPYGAAAREQAYEAFAFLLAAQQAPRAGRGARRHGGPCGGRRGGAGGGGALDRGGGDLAAGAVRADDLAAVDGVHGEGEVAGRQRHHPRRLLRRIGLPLCAAPVHDQVPRSRRAPCAVVPPGLRSRRCRYWSGFRPNPRPCPPGREPQGCLHHRTVTFAQTS